MDAAPDRGKRDGLSRGDQGRVHVDRGPAGTVTPRSARRGIEGRDPLQVPTRYLWPPRGRSGRGDLGRALVVAHCGTERGQASTSRFRDLPSAQASERRVVDVRETPGAGPPVGVEGADVEAHEGDPPVDPREVAGQQVRALRAGPREGHGLPVGARREPGDVVHDRHGSGRARGALSGRHNRAVTLPTVWAANPGPSAVRTALTSAPVTIQPHGPHQPAYQPLAVPVVPTSGTATAAMICGIGSLISCGILGIVAVILGHVAMRETRSGARGGHGMAVTGLILGYLTVLPWAIFWIMLLVGAVSVPFTAGT